MTAWTLWDDVCAFQFAPGLERSITQTVALELLHPLLLTSHAHGAAESAVPTWAFELVKALIANGYGQGDAQHVIGWCRLGDPEERSAAVLSCFGLEAQKGSVAQLVYGPTATDVKGQP